jgi:hypothetical protein
VKTLAAGSRELSEIQEVLCQGNDEKYLGRLPEYLKELEEAGFLRRDFTWNLKSGEDSKLSRFRLKDNYLRFYLKYIEKNRPKIERGTFENQSLSSLSEWPVILGLQFENLILNNRWLIHQNLGIKPEEIISENPFFQRKTLRSMGCQIDYLIQTKFNCLYICEIKFSVDPIGMSVIEEVKSKIEALVIPKGYSYRTVLIHANGVTMGLKESGYFAEMIEVSF